MLADPRQSCIVFVNLTREAASDGNDAFLARRRGSLHLLSLCRDLFAIPQTAVGEYDGKLLPSDATTSIEYLKIGAFSMWQDPELSERLDRSGVDTIFLGGAFLEEEVLISALEGARRGYDVRLLLDLSISRNEFDRTLVLARLAHHGILATTLRQALLEWSVTSGDLAAIRKIQDFLS